MREWKEARKKEDGGEGNKTCKEQPEREGMRSMKK